MATEKPKTAAGYHAAQTVACEQVLVTLLNAFGSLKDTVRLVGGLVPRYLTPELPPDVPAHAGTTDVDIVFNLQIIAEGEGYASLADQLKARGFERYQRPGANGPSSWQWEHKISDRESVVVDFLHGAASPEQEGKPILIDGEKVSALGIRHANVVHEWYGTTRVTADLLDGSGSSTETVRHADLTAFIILKAIAFDQRLENKDAGDLIHVMRYAGTPEYIAAQILDRYQSNTHPDAIDDAMNRLETRFCDGDGVEGYLRVGAVKAVRFTMGEHPDDDNARILEQRSVSGLVTELLALFRAGRAAAATSA